MTAFGFILYIAGSFFHMIFDPHKVSWSWRDSGSIAAFIGLILILCGIAKFLWEYMP